MPNEITYWDQEEFSIPYQMGKQKHRIYVLDLLKNKGVKSILDVGCGTAPIYEIIKQDNLPFVYKGTDYSWRMIETSRKLFPDGNFEVEDARKLSEENNSWDCVLLIHSLDHLDKYKQAISEAARVSKKYVCIILWRGFIEKGTSLNSVNSMGKKPGEQPWHDTHLQEYSKEVLEKEFSESGLVVEQTAEGEDVNSGINSCNFLYLLKKI